MCGCKAVETRLRLRGQGCEDNAGTCAHHVATAHVTRTVQWIAFEVNRIKIWGSEVGKVGTYEIVSLITNSPLLQKLPSYPGSDFSIQLHHI